MTVKQSLIPMNLQFFSEDSAEEIAVEAKEPTAVETDEPAEPEKTVTEVEASKTPDAAETEALSTELEALKRQLAELETNKKQLETQLEEKDNTVSSATETVAGYEAALGKIVEQRLEAIPENIKALMPEGLSIADKLTWVEKAEVAAPKEDKEQPAVIEAIGRPTPVETETEIQPENMTAAQKFQNYFQDFFGK